MTITITPHAVSMFLVVCALFWVWTNKKGGRIIGLLVAMLAAAGVNAMLQPVVHRLLQ
jgi:hypothetical protein